MNPKSAPPMTVERFWLSMLLIVAPMSQPSRSSMKVIELIPMPPNIVARFSSLISVSSTPMSKASSASTYSSASPPRLLRTVAVILSSRPSIVWPTSNVPPDSRNWKSSTSIPARDSGVSSTSFEVSLASIFLKTSKLVVINAGTSNAAESASNARISSASISEISDVNASPESATASVTISSPDNTSPSALACAPDSQPSVT